MSELHLDEIPVKVLVWHQG